jgi:hypothetical protein
MIDPALPARPRPGKRTYRRLLAPEGRLAAGSDRLSSGAPNPHDEQCEIEIRPVFEADDFGEVLTPELRAQEVRVMAGAKRNSTA